MIQYFTASDITELNNYALFNTSIPASLRLFRSTLDLGPLVYLFHSKQFNVPLLTHQAKTQTDSWLDSPAAFSALHIEFQQFTDEFVRLSEQLINSPSSTGVFSLYDFATVRTYYFLNAFNQQQETMIGLATGTYTVLPRLIEYMRNDIFLFAQRHNMLSNDRTNTAGNELQRISKAFTPPPDPALAHRYLQALGLVGNYQSAYALSYAAASNVIGHFSRLKEMTGGCLWHAIALKNATSSRHLKHRVNILLVSLKEIQRMSATANALFQTPQ